MQSVRDHYASHLAPIYPWMCGGAAAALARGDAELEALGLESAGFRVRRDAGLSGMSRVLARSPGPH